MNWFSRIFGNTEKKDETPEVRKCDFENCDQEGEHLCSFCGKMFCDIHSNPINHNCGKREFVGGEETPPIPELQIPKPYVENR